MNSYRRNGNLKGKDATGAGRGMESKDTIVRMVLSYTDVGS